MLITLFLPDSDVLTVLFPHTARDDDELTLKVNDKVTVIEKDDSGWWRGHLQDKDGLFPSRCGVVLGGNAIHLYIFDPWNLSKLKNVKVRHTTAYLNLIFLYLIIKKNTDPQIECCVSQNLFDV